MLRNSTLIRLGLVIALVATLEVLCRQGIINRMTMVPPSVMVTKLWALMGTEKFWSQVASTTRNIGAAAVLAMVAGFFGGVILHGLPRVRRALEPVMVSYYALPFFVFYPLAIVIFGMNDIPIILMGFLYALIAMVSNTISGIDRIPPVLGKVTRSFRLGPVETALLVKLPAAAPYLFTGAKLALGYSIAGVIGSEFILSAAGLGYSISFAYNDFDNPSMYALLLFVIALVTALLTVLNWAERRVRYDAASGKVTGVSGLPDATLAVKIGEGMLVTLAFIAIWQAVHSIAGSEVLTSPADTVKRAWTLAQSESFGGHLQETLRALWVSLLISCLGGALAGIILGANRRLGEIVEPLIVTFQAVPKVTLYPMILLVFGLGFTAKVAFGAMHGLVPMTLITLNAIRSLNPSLKRTARAFRLSAFQSFSTVFIPATIPEIVTAMRLSFSVTFLGVMVGEMFASKRGLGFMVMNGISINDVATMMAITLMIGVFAVVANGILLAIDNRLHWR